MKIPPAKLFLAPAGLVFLSLLPIQEFRQMLFGLLGLPFAYTTGLPFAYSDKPWFVSYPGGICIALFWSIFLLIIFYAIFLHSCDKTKAKPGGSTNSSSAHG
jgi:hypothetical protein